VIAQLKSVSLAVAVALPALTAHEGLRHEPYDDIAGVRTVCYGETEHVEERSYSTAECLVMLATRVAGDYEAPIRRCAGAEHWDGAPTEVRATHIGVAYNIGVSGWCGSSMRRRLDHGDIDGSCDALLKWDRARVHGRLTVVQSLAERRREEREFCLSYPREAQ